MNHSELSHAGAVCRALNDGERAEIGNLKRYIRLLRASLVEL